MLKIDNNRCLIIVVNANIFFLIFEEILSVGNEFAERTSCVNIEKIK